VSVCLGGHATSFSLEESFLAALKSMASHRGIPFARLVAHIDENRPPHISLFSGLRLAILHNLCKINSF